MPVISRMSGCKIVPKKGVANYRMKFCTLGYSIPSYKGTNGETTFYRASFHYWLSKDLHDGSNTISFDDNIG